MLKNSNNCAICENVNRASVCPGCVNDRLIEYNSLLITLKGRRNSLYSRLSELLAAKGKAADQRNWRVLHNDKRANLREKLKQGKEKLQQGKALVQKLSREMKVRYAGLESAQSTLDKNRAKQLEKSHPNLIYTQSPAHVAITSELLHKQSVVIKQICKLFPQRKGSVDGSDECYDQICDLRLPRGLDPFSVPSEELGASLGCMVQLLNLVVHNLAAPALHSAGFAASSSRIWQRATYWNARPSSRSNEYPLFIPRQNYSSTSVENSWTERDPNSPNNAPASPQSFEAHKDLYKGITLLKKSIACLSAYCYNSLGQEIPKDASTFEAFAKVLVTLSSSKEVRSAFSLKMASSRSCQGAQQPHKSVWDVNSISSTLQDSAHTLPTFRNISYSNLPNSIVSTVSARDSLETGKNESLMEGWDIVEHPRVPSPLQSEDVEHWTRAMFTDAKKKK